MNIEELQTTYRTQLEGIMESPLRWVDFLIEASPLYKFSFPNQVLLLQQIEKPIAVASYQQWQDIGRNVRAGSIGAYCFTTAAKGYSKRYFDVTDTEGSAESFPLIWSADTHQQKLHAAAALIDNYAIDTHRSGTRFEEAKAYQNELGYLITQTAVPVAFRHVEQYDYTNDEIMELQEKGYLDFITDSVQIAALARCGLIDNRELYYDGFEKSFNYHQMAPQKLELFGMNRRELSHSFGTIIKTASTELLRIIERGIANEHQLQSELQSEPSVTKNSREEREHIPTGGRLKSLFSRNHERGADLGDVRPEGSEDFGRTTPPTSRKNADGWNTTEISSQDGQPALFDQGSSDSGNGEHGGIQKHEHSGERRKPEQRSTTSGGKDSADYQDLFGELGITQSRQLSFTDTVTITPTLKEMLEKNAITAAEKAVRLEEPKEKEQEEKEEEALADSSDATSIPPVESPPKSLGAEEETASSSPEQDRLESDAIEETPKQSNNFYHSSRPLADIEFAAGAKARYKENIAAIRTLYSLETGERKPTADEQIILSRYSGWGGASEAFDTRSKAWTKEYRELKKLLTESEYRAARVSTLSSFFTPSSIISAMYETVERIGHIGFGEDARILEPSMGTGRFFCGLPKGLQTASLTGIELDSLSARMSKALFPDATIYAQGFEETSFLDEQFDLIIGNIPFGNFRLADPLYDKHRFMVHDYFFAKSLDNVRSGGIIAFITSSGTLDKSSATVRKYLAQKSDLLGAVRLPNNAFSNSGTAVTSDILFLQKRFQPRDIAVDRPSWLDLGTDENGTQYNRYFIENPHMLLGTPEMISGQFGETFACLPIEGSNLAELLTQSLSTIQGFVPPALETEEREISGAIPAPPHVKNYSYTIISSEQGEDLLYFREHSALYPEDTNATAVQRIKGMNAIRIAARELTTMQAHLNTTDDEILAAQIQLNMVYDDFVKEFDSLHKPINKRVFAKDIDANFILALEVQDSEQELVYRKEDIFTKRTVYPVKQILSAENAHDALYVVLSEVGHIDFSRIQDIYDQPIDSIIEELGSSVYRNPALVTEEAYSGWEKRADYLSGNIASKIRQAEYAMSKDDNSQEYGRNVRALEEVMPTPLGAGDISVRIGATWIDNKYYSQFLWETFKTPRWQQSSDGKGISAEYNEHLDQWRVLGKNRDTGIEANEVFGTKRMSAYHIIERSLNLDTAKVYDRIDNKSVINHRETQLARGKQAQIEQVFTSWIFQDAERRHSLEQRYNAIFNNVAIKQYDGSYLKLPQPSSTFIPYIHQKNAIARITDDSDNTLLDHEVGTGKTATMIIGAQERLRMQLSHRVMIAVPNHIVEQFGETIFKLYPNAKAMVVSEKDFQKDNRQQFLSRIAMSDIQIIVLGHTQFTRIPLSPIYEQEMLEREIDDTMTALTRQRESAGERYSVKQMERELANLQAKLQIAYAAPSRDDVISFEELGIDTLMIDEADLFKNCRINTKLNNVAGIGTADSQRASDMLLKTRYVGEKGGKLVFATGTPISNAISEMYVMQRYLQEETLKAKGLSTFDQWVSTFATTTTSLELAPEGNGYRAKTRLSQYFNLPELMQLYGAVADTVTAEETDIERPALISGGPITITTAPSQYQLDWMQDAVPRCADIRSGTVPPEEDNMLVFTQQAKLMSIDERLIDPTAPHNATGKLATLADIAVENYEKTTAELGTQLIFSDMGAPSKQRFNVYDEIKIRLIERGIPDQEIKYIHDAKTTLQKEELFEEVRNGKVRILIASTEKCGAGTNIQDRLYAIHHVDCPYRPRDLTQRNGRGHRQGNLFEEIAIYQYITEKTFDAYSWSILSRKQTFIEQIGKGAIGERTYIDKDSDLLNFETVQAIATGNPLMQEKINIDSEINNFQFLLAEFKNQQYRIEDNLKLKLPQQIVLLTARCKSLQSDCEMAQENHSPDFRMIVGEKNYTERADAGTALLGEVELYAENPENTEPKKVGEYHGFGVYLKKNAFSGYPFLSLHGKTSHDVDINAESGVGTITRIENTVERFPNLLEKAQQELEQTTESVKQAELQLNADFPHHEELRTLLARQAEIDMELNLQEDDIILDEGSKNIVQEIEIELELDLEL